MISFAVVLLSKPCEEVCSSILIHALTAHVRRQTRGSNECPLEANAPDSNLRACSGSHDCALWLYLGHGYFSSPQTDISISGRRVENAHLCLVIYLPSSVVVPALDCPSHLAFVGPAILVTHMCASSFFGPIVLGNITVGHVLSGHGRAT